MNTSFTGASALDMGSGIMVQDVQALSPQVLEATIAIDSTARVGYRSVRVTTGGEVATDRVTGPFFVSAPASEGVPRLVSVAPSEGAAGNTLTVEITGENTDFAPDTSAVSFSGTGLTVLETTVTSPTVLSASVRISEEAAPGFRDLRVTTGASVAVLLDGFAVTADADPPEVTLVESATLWPPNHQYVSFAVADMVASVTDSVAGPVPLDSVRIASVSSDEPENGPGDGNTTEDIVITDDARSVQLRRERQGRGNGRVYTVNLTVSDPSGNVAEAAYRVSVPHNRNSEAIDDGPAYTVESGVGEAATTAAAESEGGVPAAFALKSPYPNPTRGRATLPLELPERASVRVEAFDVLGRRVRVLAEERFEAGRHPLAFEAARLASGLYLIRATVETAAGEQRIFTAKVTVVK